MNEVIQFLLEHWMLSVGVLIVGGWLVFEELRSRASGVPSISPQKAISMMNRDAALLIDVRGAEMFEAGHILGARNIPTATLSQEIEGSLQSHRDKPVIVVCQKGISSKAASNILRKAGFSAVHNLEGGVTAWQAAGLPLTKEEGHGKS